MILCGDIGGTKTLLALADLSSAVGSGLQLHCQQHYLAREYVDFDALFAAYMATLRAAGYRPQDIRAGCLAVAGPVPDNAARDGAALTNLPWHIHPATLASTHGCGPLQLVNDFVAMAAGVRALHSDGRQATNADDSRPAHLHALHTLQRGQPLAQAPCIVIGAGTGLGTAALVWSQDRNEQTGHYQILAGEGGHCAFAPMDAEQAALWAWLAERLPAGRVTVEQVVSGRGLQAIYAFLCARHAAEQCVDVTTAADPAAAISALAMQSEHSLARQAVRLFCRAYGAFAGDLALTLLARGGVYLTGGMATHLLPLLQATDAQAGPGDFLSAFNAKAEHATLAATMPVHVCTDPALGLKGAALLALANAQISGK